MNAAVTPDAERAVADIAQRYGLSRESVHAMLVAVRAGGGTMAQFDIPELGGSGQWMRGGMTMVGDMFNHGLKARVDGLCAELAELLSTTTVFTAPPPGASAGWWPAELGTPSSAGGQNDARYAVFPATRRLAVRVGGVTRVFDTGEHRIGGVAQQQSGGPGSVTFTSQLGTFDVSSLREISSEPTVSAPAAAPSAPSAPSVPSVPSASSAPSVPSGGDSASIIAAIEALAGLHARGILTDEEFTNKKAELLSRL
jgi:hypothetical protein